MFFCSIVPESPFSLGVLLKGVHLRSTDAEGNTSEATAAESGGFIRKHAAIEGLALYLDSATRDSVALTGDVPAQVPTKAQPCQLRERQLTCCMFLSHTDGSLGERGELSLHPEALRRLGGLGPQPRLLHACQGAACHACSPSCRHDHRHGASRRVGGRQ